MTQKYNIAIIAGQLVVGGAERQLYLWLSHLDRERFQPLVLTLHPNHDDYWENPIRQLGIPLKSIPQRPSRIVRLLDIVRVLRPYRPQLIHGWHLFSSPYAGVAGKLLGAKSLGGVRGSFSTFLSAHLEANLTLHLVDAIIANSNGTAEQLREVRKSKKQVVYAIQNAVEAQTVDRDAMRQELGQRFGISTEVIWIGSLGRLDSKKHFDMILKVLALLKNDVKGFHFILIGNGPERLRLEEMVVSLDLAEFVTFTGEIPLASKLLNVLDIFCFTSLDEGLPNVVMEAAVAGVPIVAWSVFFMEELLDTESMALLIEPENIVDFKNALLNLIQSPQLRKKIGMAGRDHILENFTLMRFVQRMTNVYEGLLGIQQESISGEL